jgi:hypothetical protein
MQARFDAANDFLESLPDGLDIREGRVVFQCRVCERWTEWEADPADFQLGDPHNVCGRSPRCCP